MGGRQCKLAWRTVCSLTIYGLMGMTDLRLFGFALRLRWEWLQRAEPDRGWVRLPAKHEPIAVSMF